MSELILQTTIDENIWDIFFQNFYMPILQDIFFVLTDGSHKAGFQLQLDIIIKLFALIENNLISAEIQPGMSNKDYVVSYLTNAL